MVYRAQVQFLSWEIEKNRPNPSPFDPEWFGFDVVCGVCGGSVPARRAAKMVPVCYDCAKGIGASNEDFATEYGLVNYEASENVNHIRQLHVLILVAIAERVRRK